MREKADPEVPVDESVIWYTATPPKAGAVLIRCNREFAAIRTNPTDRRPEWVSSSIRRLEVG